ncbi:hypothetical protein V5799_006393 [Amblyomma americanum]|uniref:Uncharacterized protein n=1 Tax=Amblyomma americanum TaxID=6943 RepID=A0AAQ4DWI6_AMBAM
MDHWYRQPKSFGNLGAAEWKELAIPGDGTFSRCTMRDPPDGGSDARIVCCSAWNFDLGANGNTIVREFTLICDRQWLIQLMLVASSAASIVSLPIVIGLSIVIGAAADRVGRKTVAHTSLLALLLAGVTGQHADRSLRAPFRGGDAKPPRPALGGGHGNNLYRRAALFYATDSLWLSWKGVQLLLMMPAMLMLANLCMNEETHNWLLVVWNTCEAERVAMRAAAANGVSPDEFLDGFNRVMAEHEQRVGAVDVCSPRAVISPRFRATSATLAFVRTAENISYNLINLNNLNNILASHWWSQLLNAVIAGPASLAVYPCMQRVGVRWIGVLSCVVFSLTAAVLSALYTEESTSVAVSLLVGAAGLASNATLVASFVITAALYPTGCRCFGFSAAFAWGSLGSLLGHANWHPISRAGSSGCRWR